MGSSRWGGCARRPERLWARDPPWHLAAGSCRAADTHTLQQERIKTSRQHLEQWGHRTSAPCKPGSLAKGGTGKPDVASVTQKLVLFYLINLSSHIWTRPLGNYSQLRFATKSKETTNVIKRH